MVEFFEGAVASFPSVVFVEEGGGTGGVDGGVEGFFFFEAGCVAGVGGGG